MSSGDSSVKPTMVVGGTLVVNAVRGEYLDPTEHGLWFYAISVGGAYNFAEHKDMLEHAGFTGIGDANLVDLRIQPVKAGRRPQDV